MDHHLSFKPWLLRSFRERSDSSTNHVQHWHCQAFDHLNSIPRSYFLGHHAAGLSKMKALLASIDLVVECRDYRTPLVSRNPLFEQNLGEKPRMIIYTHQDLGSNNQPSDKQVSSLWFDQNETDMYREKKSFSDGMHRQLHYSLTSNPGTRSERFSTLRESMQKEKTRYSAHVWW